MKSNSSIHAALRVPHPLGSSKIRAILFDAENGDQEVGETVYLKPRSIRKTQLLWVDLEAASQSELRDLAAVLSLPEGPIEGYLGTETNPLLETCGKFFWLRVVVVDDTAGPGFSGTVLTMIAGGNIVITLHRQRIPFLDAFRDGRSGKDAVGILTAGSLIASLLDWQLETYFGAVSKFEMSVERLEVEVLAPRPRDCLSELRALRKGASRLRRMLAPHRVVFSALSRPDFRPQEDEKTERHFRVLDTHFERAMDMVENARDLVVGSFELFGTQTALTVNETMKLLTFATVVIGVLAVIGGVLGMNFEVPFFKTGVVGFSVVVVAMVGLALGAVAFGRWRRWF
jgi:Mg2+ and Co2+ transporter CorA